MVLFHLLLHWHMEIIFLRYSFAKDVHMKLLQIIVFQWFCTVFHNLSNHTAMHRFWFIILWIVSRNIKIGLEHLLPFSSPEQLLFLLRLQILVNGSIWWQRDFQTSTTCLTTLPAAHSCPLCPLKVCQEKSERSPVDKPRWQNQVLFSRGWFFS